MKDVCCLALLAGMLVLLFVLLHPPDAAVGAVGQNFRQNGHAELVTAGYPRDALLRRRAEVALQKTASLRRQQTGTSLRAAIPLLREAARLFRNGGDSARAADSYVEIGEIHSTLGNYNQALISYQESLHLAAGDLPRSCRARSRMARTYASMGRSSDADSSVQDIEKLCKGVSETNTLAEMSLAQGEVLYFARDFSKSSEQLRQARTYFAQAGDRGSEAQALLLLAETAFENDQRAAIQFAEKALRLSSSPLNRQGVAKARRVLGIFAATLGQFETAQCNSSAASEIFHDLGDRDREAAVLNALGKVARETGDLQMSLEHYRRARVVFASIQDRLGEAIAINGIGVALTPFHQYQQVLELYNEELRVAQQANSPLLIAFALMDLADVDRLQHRYRRAEARYRRSLAVFQSIEHRSGQGDVLIRLAYLEAKQGRDAEAISFLDQARPPRVKTGQAEELAKIDYELAFLYRRMGRLEDALAAIERTIKIIESQRLQIANFDSRAAYFAAVHQYYSLYIQVLMALHKQHPEQGFAQRALEASEKSKVRSLLDLLTVSNQNSPCDELLLRSLNPPSGGDNPAEASIPPVLNLEQIQAEIQDDDTVLLEYALGDENSYLWVVERNHIVSYELPPAEHLRRLARSFMAGLAPLQPAKGETASEYDERIRAAKQASALHAKELSRLLVGQISLPPEKRVLIVPDGFLQSIPFSALPLPAAGERNAVLLTHHEVVVLPSATVLDALRAAAGKRSPPTSGIAVLADPVFQLAQTDQPVAQRSRSVSPALNRALRDIQGAQQPGPLPGSGEEADAIQKIFGPDAFIARRYDANRESVLNGLVGHYRVVHFATHGLIDLRHPEMSGLVLSLFNKRGKPQDGYLRLGDIYKLKLSADLVVLSTCESALGKELESEGIFGLPRGFLYAGARSVIASLWKVEDDATRALMAHLYRRIKQGQTVGAALRSAQLDMAKDPQYSQSNGWAAFVLLGDYNYSIEFRTAL